MFHQNLLWFSSLCLVYWSYEQVAYPYGRRPFFDSRRLHWIMMLSLRVIMSSCHLVNHFIVSSFMSSSHRVIILSCHHVILSIISSCHHLCHQVIVSSYYNVIISSCHHVIIYVIIASCHRVIVSSCHHFIICVIIASCQVANFWQVLAAFDNLC